MAFFFSIIIPVYNRASFLPVTLGHILNQTFKDFEVIIVDDGSQDGSYEKAKEFETQQVKVFKKENGERGAARNFGAKKATGRYLIFFDSDDIMYPFHLEKAHDFLVNNNFPEVAYTAFEFVNPEGKVFKRVFVDNTNLKHKLAKENFLGCNSVIIREDVFKAFWFVEDRKLSTTEDKELWLRVASVYAFHFIPAVTFAMVEHADRSLNRLTPEKIEEKTNTLIHYLESSEHFKAGFKDLKGFIYAFESVLVSSEWSGAGDRRKAREYLLKSISYSGKVIFSKRFLAALKNYFLLYK